MKKTLAFLFLVTVLLSACAGKKEAFSLSDTQWELVSYGDADQPTSALPNVATSISFGANGDLNGNVGCNLFSGSYTVSGNTLTAGPLVGTRKACEAPLMNQENAVMQLLNGTLTFEGDSNTLKIFSADGTSMLLLTHAK